MKASNKSNPAGYCPKYGHGGAPVQYALPPNRNDDFGVPMETCYEQEGQTDVFVRRYTKSSFTVDCKSFKGTFRMGPPPPPPPPPPRPLVLNMGSVDIGEIVETTPIVVDTELWRFEAVHVGWHGSVTPGANYLRFVHVRTGVTTPPLPGSAGFALGSAYTDGKVVYAFGTFCHTNDRCGAAGSNNEIRVWWSIDGMKSWQSQVALTGSELWNQSVDKGKLEGVEVFVMAIETRAGGSTQWNTQFATAPEPRGPWALLSSSHRMRPDVEHACPTIRYSGGWFYLMTGRERGNRIKCTGNATSPSSPKFFTEISRSRDLITWHNAPDMGTPTSLGGMLLPNKTLDKRPAPAEWAPKEVSYVTNHRNETEVWDDCNLSDLDLCEYNNQTVMFWCWGLNGDPPTPPMKGGLVLGISPMPLASFLSQWFPPTPPTPPINASANRQLFLDDSLIQESSGVEIVMHPLQLPREVDAAGYGDEHGPVLVPEHPWEGARIAMYNSLVDNGTHILLYYDVRPGPFKCKPGLPPCGKQGTPWTGADDIQRATCLAISEDGVRFVKPDLGLVAYNGSTHNNIVWPVRNRSHPEFVPWSYYPGTVFMDSQAPLKSRFKMIANWASLRAAPYNAGTWLFDSPDGIHFNPVSMVWQNSDSQDVAMFDSILRKYVGFRRLGFLDIERPCHSCRYGNATANSSRLCGPGEPGGRYVGRCESSSWGKGSFAGCNQPNGDNPRDPSTLLTVFGPDEHDDPCIDIYTNQISIYEGVYLSFPAAYFHFPNGVCENNYCEPSKFGGPGPWIITNDGTHDTRFAHSRDGKQFSYVAGDRRPFLGLGPSGGLPIASLVEPQAPLDPTTWRSSMIQAVQGLVVRNDTIMMYFWGARCREGQDNCDAWRYRTHKYPAGGDGAIIQVKIRIDGFASIGTNTNASGSFTTEPLFFTGSKLLLNANISSPGGEIRVGVRRADGNQSHQLTIERCIPVRADAVSAEVAWQGTSGLAELVGVPLQLQFSLRQARLYSFRFEEHHEAKLKTDDPFCTGLFAAGSPPTPITSAPAAHTSPLNLHPAVLSSSSSSSAITRRARDTAACGRVPTAAPIKSDEESSHGRVQPGTLALNVTDCGPPNLLPPFSFMSPPGESLTHLNPGASAVAQPFVPGSGELSCLFSPACPSDVFENLLTESQRRLPFLLLDQYRSERTPSSVPTFDLIGSGAAGGELRAAFTPQWGGKIYALQHRSATGRVTDLVHSPKTHQPVMASVRNAQVDGGIEWNWSPGLLGHWALTEDHVFAARMPAPWGGDVLRIYAFDRFNHTAMQVDSVIVNGTLFSHPKVFNAGAVDQRGYWWTCVGQRFTAWTQACRPSANNPGSRILSPALYSIVTGEGGGRPAPWPRYNQYCCQDAGGAYAKGAGLDVPPSFHSPTEPEPTFDAASDMSYMGNFLSGSEDIFLRILRPQRPYVAIVDRDIFGDELRGLYHGHDINGTKFWEGGAGRGSQRWYFHSDAPASPNGLGNNSGGCGDCGCFTELQTGVAPTQLHTFLLPKKSSKEWTEFWTTMHAVPDADLYSTNYTETLKSVEQWIESGATGSGSVPQASFDEIDERLREHATVPVQPSQILHDGDPFGALHEQMQAKFQREANPGARSKENFPSLHFRVAPQFKELARPWIELLSSVGTFSATSLAVAAPSSYMVDVGWETLIQRSATAHGWTWLHHLHIGVNAVERFNFVSAREHFTASLALKQSAIAARNLAVIADTGDKRWTFYTTAWRLAAQAYPTIQLSWLATARLR
jgi:hypothetical protein